MKAIPQEHTYRNPVLNRLIQLFNKAHARKDRAACLLIAREFELTEV